MPDASLEFDTTAFVDAVKYAFKNTKKTVAEIVNRAALVAIIGGKGVQGAMQRTPKASAAAIRDVDVGIIAAVVRRKHKGEKLTKNELNRLIKKEYNRRVAAIGYTANVGWNNAAVAFGGRGIGRRATGRGYASEGKGTPAPDTVADVVTAEFTNAAPAASMIGHEPLQAALNDTARDMVEHINQKMTQHFEEANAKK